MTRRPAAALKALLTALLTAVLCVGLVGLVPTAASASTDRARDAADGEGRLDLRAVTLKTSGKTSGKAKRASIVATIATHDRFRRDDLDNANSLQVVFKLSPRKYRGVRVFFIGDDLTATLCTYRTADSNRGENCSTIRVQRSSASSVRFTARRTAISRADVLQWRARSVAWAQTAGCETAPSCDDYAGRGATGFRTWRP